MLTRDDFIRMSPLLQRILTDNCASKELMNALLNGRDGGLVTLDDKTYRFRTAPTRSENPVVSIDKQRNNTMKSMIQSFRKTFLRALSWTAGILAVLAIVVVCVWFLPGPVIAILVLFGCIWFVMAESHRAKANFKDESAT